METYESDRNLSGVDVKAMRESYDCMIRVTEDLILRKELPDHDQGIASLLLTLEKLRIKRDRLLK